METRKSLKHISQQLGTGEARPPIVEKLARSYGVEMDADMKQQAAQLGSNQLVAHAIAERVLSQVNSGRSDAEVMSDLGQTKKSLKLAQRAFFDKDPEAIQLLQLDDK